MASSPLQKAKSFGFSDRQIAALVGAIVPIFAATAGIGGEKFAIYDADPNHLWNRLFTAFYVREIGYAHSTSDPALTPKRLGPDGLDPPLGRHAQFLLEDKPFRKCNAVLAEFLAQNGENLITAPLRRAVLQRDLWAVFDLLQETGPENFRNYGDEPPAYTTLQQERREILSRKIAIAMRRLALSRDNLENLPANYPLAIKSRQFPSDVASQAKADYLPADLFSPPSSWEEVFPLRDKPFSHTRIVGGRSVFRVFLRPPKNEERPEKFRSWLKQVQEGVGDRKGVPVGSEFLLLREMVGIDQDLNLVPTRVVESVQLRVYVTDTAKEAESSQLFEEFDMHRPLLFSGKQGGLKPTSEGEPRFFGYMALGRLAVNDEAQCLPLNRFPQNCFTCHVAFNERTHQTEPSGPPTLQSLDRPFSFGGPNVRYSATNTIHWKEEQKDFRRLRELWREN
jgi:hypothetical protein